MEQIGGIIREYEAGAQLAALWRRHDAPSTTFCKRRAGCGGMTASDAKRLRALEDEENRRLKRLPVDATLDNRALKGLLAKNG